MWDNYTSEEIKIVSKIRNLNRAQLDEFLGELAYGKI